MGSVAPLLLAGAGIVCFGTLLHIIGVGTVHWIDITARGVDVGIGLFKVCQNDQCRTIDDPDSELEAARAFLVLGLLAGLLGGASVLLFVLFSIMSKNLPKLVALVCTAACLAAFGMIILGCIIFASKVYEPYKKAGDLGFSFGLSIVGALMLGAGGVIVFIGNRNTSS